METDKLVKHLASVLGDNFNLTFDDIEKEELETDKEIIYGLICLHDDLHFYKKRSEHLLDNFKNTLFNSAAITISNSKGIIKNVNNFFLNLCGYSEEELIGKRLGLIDANSNQNPNLKQLKSDITAGKTWRGEVRSVKKNGGIFWLNTHVFPIKNTEGDVYEYWSVSTDITKNKQNELELINKNKELEQFSYILSHDLKTPVIQVNQLVDLINEEYGASFNEDCKNMFDLLRSRTARLGNLIDGILEYSRADYDTTQDSPIDLNKLIKNLLEITAIPEKFEFQISDNLPTITGNRIKIEQIFENFLSNSIKYMDKKRGIISLTFDDSMADFYTFEFSDNGSGIEQKHLTSIFDMFVTVHGQSRIDSTGIGLAVVKKIITSCGGQIECRSRLGEGTTFQFTWPKS